MDVIINNRNVNSPMFEQLPTWAVVVLGSMFLGSLGIIKQFFTASFNSFVTKVESKDDEIISKLGELSNNVSKMNLQLTEQKMISSNNGARLTELSNNYQHLQRMHNEQSTKIATLLEWKKNQESK